MKDLLNELSKNFVFDPPNTGSYGYIPHDLRDKESDKQDSSDGSSGDPGGAVGESNTTSNIDGGEGPPRTPYAFSNKSDTHKKKRMSNIEVNRDYTLVGDLYETFEHQIKDIEDSVNEISYRSFKKDNRTGREKVNKTLIEVYQKLKEVESLLDVNVKLKKEDDLHGEMWPKASPKRMRKIDMKINSIKRKLKEMY